MIWLLVAVAHAHPFQNAFYGHDVALTVEPDALRVDYRADLPTQELWSELRAVERSNQPTERFTADKVNELFAGLSLSIDGARPALTQVDSEPPEVDERFTRLHVAFTAPLDPGVAHTIAFGNANAPEKLAYFRVSTRIARPWLVAATSLVEPDRVWEGQWRIEEAARSFTVDLLPRTGPSAWVLAVHPDPTGRRSAALALDTSLVDELGQTWVPLVGFAAALVAVGAFAWRRRAA